MSIPWGVFGDSLNVSRPDDDSAKKCRYEYLKQCLLPGELYSLPIENIEVQPDGNFRNIVSKSYFQITSRQPSSGRSKVTPRWDLDDDPSRSSFATAVQYLDVRRQNKDESITLFFGTGAAFANALDIAP